MDTIKDYLLSLEPSRPLKGIKFRSTKVRLPFYLSVLIDAHLSDRQKAQRAWNRACYLLHESNAKGRAINCKALESAMLSLYFSTAMRKARIMPDDLVAETHETRYTLRPLTLYRGMFRAIVINSGEDSKGKKGEALYSPYIVKTYIDKVEDELFLEVRSKNISLSEDFHLDCLRKRLIAGLLDETFFETPIPTA